MVPGPWVSKQAALLGATLALFPLEDVRERCQGPVPRPATPLSHTQQHSREATSGVGQAGRFQDPGLSLGVPNCGTWTSHSPSLGLSFPLSGLRGEFR